MSIYKKAIAYLFYALFFLVPLVLYPNTSEIFEFNKMVVTYLITSLIVGVWIIRMITHKKFIFKRTILDLPLLIFLISQTLSTLVSFDTRTSLLGYYSRFHGGLISTISYSLLYWAYVSNMDKKSARNSLFSSFLSGVLVSIYGVLQRFGIDAHVWVQDVQNRIFSTLGQPNWLAAWITALTPITWGFSMHSKYKVKNKILKVKNFWIFLSLSSLFFLTLLYTKSRSGILGFAVANITFWILISLIGLFKTKNKLDKKSILKKFLWFNLAFLIIAGLIGTPWTPNLRQSVDKLQKRPPKIESQTEKAPIPAMERGGTASGEIRKIVWTGAVDIFKAYPVLGTGVETFAYSYYSFRPIEHNLVSEWDFLYNKAHNEYLNYAATTGGLGILSYMVLILFTLFLLKLSLLNNPNTKTFLKNLKSANFFKSNLSNNHAIIIGLFSGYLSILVTNFFGFSVVPVALQFFLYPAIALTITKGDKQKVTDKKIKLDASQKAISLIMLLATCYLLLVITKYWYADVVYNKGKLLNDIGNYSQARNRLTKAVDLSPKEAFFWEELAQATTNLALALHEGGNEDAAYNLANEAVGYAQKSESLSSKNVNIKRKMASMYIKLSSLDQNYLIEAKEKLNEAIELAPTDAKLWYNLALTNIRTGERERAIEILEKTIKMKPDYRNARFALALTYYDEGDVQKAIEELEYVLEKINPDDQAVQRQLQEIRN